VKDYLAAHATRGRENLLARVSTSSNDVKPFHTALFYNRTCWEKARSDCWSIFNYPEFEITRSSQYTE
jgi:hypothetical protein